MKEEGTRRNEKETVVPFSYEFGGPLGAFFTSFFLPPLVMILSYWTHVGFVDVQSLTQWEKLRTILIPDFTLEAYFYCSVGLLGWFGVLVLLWAILPGAIVKGSVVAQAKSIQKKDELRLSYKINGHLTFWVVMGGLFGQPRLNPFLYRYFDLLAFLACLMTSLLSLYFYVGSHQKDKVLSNVGNSGNPFYDFWMGRELNPRMRLPFLSSLDFDWKQFCELRPGLIGWVLLNYACLQEQREVLGYVTPSMYLINALQAFYVWDALYQERAILTTMDITTDGFGFMLCFGDLAWVPFTYTVPAKFLVHHDPQLSTPVIAAILSLYLFGFYIFRSANGEKDRFRRNPNDSSVSHLSFLQTKRGTKLLTSGWWGTARKVNYTGDYIMGLTYSLLCGFDSLVPYYYAVYFCVLLIHRSMRDDELCHLKYGDDWLEYKRQVPYRFIPGIF